MQLWHRAVLAALAVPLLAGALVNCVLNPDEVTLPTEDVADSWEAPLIHQKDEARDLGHCAALLRQTALLQLAAALPLLAHAAWRAGADTDTHKALMCAYFVMLLLLLAQSLTAVVSQSAALCMQRSALLVANLLALLPYGLAGGLVYTCMFDSLTEPPANSAPWPV